MYVYILVGAIMAFCSCGDCVGIMSFSHLFLSLSPETEYGRGGPLIQCVFSVLAIVRNCGLSLGSGGQVSRKRGEQDVLIELGKLGCYRGKKGCYREKGLVIGKKGVVIGKKVSYRGGRYFSY